MRLYNIQGHAEGIFDPAFNRILDFNGVECLFRPLFFSKRGALPCQSGRGAYKCWVVSACAGIGGATGA